MPLHNHRFTFPAAGNRAYCQPRSQGLFLGPKPEKRPWERGWIIVTVLELKILAPFRFKRCNAIRCIIQKDQIEKSAPSLISAPSRETPLSP